MGRNEQTGKTEKQKVNPCRRPRRRQIQDFAKLDSIYNESNLIIQREREFEAVGSWVCGVREPLELCADVVYSLYL